MVLVLRLTAAGVWVSSNPPGVRGVLRVYIHHNTARDQAPAYSVKQTDTTTKLTQLHLIKLSKESI